MIEFQNFRPKEGVTIIDKGTSQVKKGLILKSNKKMTIDHYRQKILGKQSLDVSRSIYKDQTATEQQSINSYRKSKFKDNVQDYNDY